MDPRSLGTILLLMIALVNAGKSRQPVSHQLFTTWLLLLLDTVGNGLWWLKMLQSLDPIFASISHENFFFQSSNVFFSLS